MALNRAQTRIKAAIVAHGRRHGINAPTIQIAADVAYLESSFGADSHSASPGSTASGLFRYTDEAWREHHYTLGSKDDPSNQTAAFYNDLARYVSWPGQALAYKLGEIEIVRLRRKAETELGADFDIRAFHDKLISLLVATIPAMTAEMEDFISQSKAAANAARAE